jgi:Flp pilus assembly protein CpaB
MLAIGSLALVMLSMAVFTSMYARAGHQIAVLAIDRNVPQGQRIAARDLSVIEISFSARLKPVPASDAAKVVGHEALVPLVAGTLLGRDELVGRPAIPQGDAVVGVAVQQGQLPAGGVTPGDRVDVVFTGAPGASDSLGLAASSTPAASEAFPSVAAGGVLAQGVTVTAVDNADAATGATVVVSVIVPSTVAPLVANASAARQAAVVLVGSGS